ncbi:MAG: hypothetical protein E6X21_03240 [Clostridium sp.]|uniref:hypothetical protein n=1 Tax=Clostridium sp. TaxID=1506 RepID=UPI0029083F9D|nr:hypothetical protein [Clostridium sp.]
MSKFISSEEFLKQSKKVQETFKTWWKPSYGDFYIWDMTGFGHTHIASKSEKGLILPIKSNVWDEKKICIPLFRIDQLIEFIEDKTDGKIDIEWGGINGYSINIAFKNGWVNTYEDDLLKALWKVALKIVKEELAEEENE